MHEGYRHVVREHVYDECWALDITWEEVEHLRQRAVIEHHDLGEAGAKEIRLPS